MSIDFETKTQKYLSQLEKLVNEKLGRPIKKFIPPLHYHTHKISAGDLTAEIYRIFRRFQVPAEKTPDGLYFIHTEIFQGQEVITAGKVYTNPLPAYDVLNKDGTIDLDVAISSSTNDTGCVTAQLLVINPYRGQEDLLADVGLIPIYGKLKFALYKFIEQRPLIDDERYREYVEWFSSIGRWIVSSSKPVI